MIADANLNMRQFNQKEETMELNQVVKQNKTKKVMNEEGYAVYRRRVDQDLFLHAISFTPRNSYYHSDTERLNYLVELVQKNDQNYVEALSWYLGKNLGIRLSPTIMTTELALLDNPNWTNIKKIVRDVFTRPDFLANAAGYIKYKFNTKSFLDRMPAEFKKMLKEQLESFSELTLKKRRLRRRAIKLADLIKTLRPHPKTDEMSRLYKAIIENDKAASLKVVTENGKITSAEHITAAISSDKVTQAEKRKFVQENIKNIPINALIKNLTFLRGEDAPILEQRLDSAFQSGDGLRFINPFNLILLGDDEIQVDPKIIRVLDKMLQKYVHVNIETKKPLILYDNSGSMTNEPHATGTKFITLLNQIFRKDFRLYTFNEDEKNITEEIKDIYNQSRGMNEFAHEFYKKIKCYYGTSLLKSMKNVLQECPEADLFIVVTDEVTWADGNAIESYRRVLPDRLLGRTILFNACPGVGSVFKPGAEITRLAGLSGRIIPLMKAISNFDNFKQDVMLEFQRI